MTRWDAGIKVNSFLAVVVPRRLQVHHPPPRNENRVLRQCRKTLLRNLLHDVTPERLELSTQWLRVICSTNWATESYNNKVFSDLASAKVEVILFSANLFIAFFYRRTSNQLFSNRFLLMGSHTSASAWNAFTSRFFASFFFSYDQKDRSVSSGRICDNTRR